MQYLPSRQTGIKDGHRWPYIMDSEIEPLLMDGVPQPADFKLESSFTPNGDQPAAIQDLVAGITADERDQVLLGLQAQARPSPSPM